MASNTLGDTSNLTPEQIAAIQKIVASTPGYTNQDGTSTQWWDPTGQFQYSRHYATGTTGTGDAQYATGPDRSNYTDGYGAKPADGLNYNTYDSSGKYGGQLARDDGSGGAILKLALMAAGGSLLGGTGAAADLGTGGSAGLSGAYGGASGATAAAGNGLLNAKPATPAGGISGDIQPMSNQLTGVDLTDPAYAGTTTGGVTPGGALGDSAPDWGSTIAGDGVNANSGGLLDGLGGLKTVGGIAAALAGALGNKDQKQTVTTTGTKDPWGPAQDWIKSNIAQGTQLQSDYMNNPFNTAQKTQYGNIAGLLNGINGNQGALTDFINRGLTGANAYDPLNPRKNIGVGGPALTAPTMSGLLNYFPKG